LFVSRDFRVWPKCSLILWHGHPLFFCFFVCF
jgi:hypothetical protein